MWSGTKTTYLWSFLFSTVGLRLPVAQGAAVLTAGSQWRANAVLQPGVAAHPTVLEQWVVSLD